MSIICHTCGTENEVQPGQMLGSQKSEAKAATARENGKLGGRPRKDGSPARRNTQRRAK